MRKLLIAVMVIIPLFGGFFPPTVNSTVTAVSGSSATLSKSFPVNGMSGVVIHNFGKGISAISSVAIQTSMGSVKLLKDDLLGDKKLPRPKIVATVGDRVIGGYLYNNVLLIAPNAQTYSKVTSSASRHWIHPDIYAAFLGREGDSRPTLSNLKKFAKEAQVGLVYIVMKDKAVLLDPVSGVYINSMPFTPVGTESKAPFYMRFNKFKSGLFGGSGGNYYKIVESIR